MLSIALKTCNCSKRDTSMMCSEAPLWRLAAAAATHRTHNFRTAQGQDRFVLCFGLNMLWRSPKNATQSFVICYLLSLQFHNRLMRTHATCPCMCHGHTCMRHRRRPITLRFRFQVALLPPHPHSLPKSFPASFRVAAAAKVAGRVSVRVCGGRGIL